MNTVISFLKQIRLDRVVIILVAGVFLLVGTGCSNSRDLQSKASSSSTRSEASPFSDRVAPRVPAPQSSGRAGTYNDRVSEQTELYDPIQERKGGMNNFSDVDPRANTKPANDKASALIKNARQNTQRVDNPGDFADDYQQGAPIGERTGNVIERVRDAAQNTAEGLTKGAQRGVENLKDNASMAADEFSEGARKSNINTQDPPKRVLDNAREGVNNAAESLNRNRA